MDIVIVSEFSESFAKDDNDRFLYLAKMLAEKHETELVTSAFRHSLKTRRTEPADPWPFRITFRFFAVNPAQISSWESRSIWTTSPICTVS